MLSYPDFFRLATGHELYPYQPRVLERWPAILEIPTGLGKTEATVLAWVYRRLTLPVATPRLLVYCLPMRTLVEQTRDRIGAMRQRLLAVGIDAIPAPEILMGGDVDDLWFRTPETPAILIGTQDLLLSRALNRGYAMSRFQWPMAFGAINNDALWIVDEVQIQGVGATTAAQLQGLREKLGTSGPVHTIFTTATLDRRVIATPDYTLGDRSCVTLSDEDLAHPAIAERIGARKTLQCSSETDAAAIGDFVAAHHRANTLTLVVLNTVRRAREAYSVLERKALPAESILLHSRFRAKDRARLTELLYKDIPAVGRIVVSTQVVEAGVDIDAALLVTDLAPWSSMVQRFGRCNRSGRISDAMVLWLDPGQDLSKKQSLPYAPEELKAAREPLLALEGKSVCSRDLPAAGGAPLEALSTLRRIDLLDLFDTSSDVMGHDVDVSAYIRDADDATVSILWRHTIPSREDPPRREEFCAVPIGQARDFVAAIVAGGRPEAVRVVDSFVSGSGAWVPARKDDLRPGDVLWAHVSAGGYDEQRGFVGTESKSAVPEIVRSSPPKASDECNETGGDALSSVSLAKTITQHGRETAEEARALLESLSGVIPSAVSALLEKAALWHDVGKAHDVFQKTMRRDTTLAPDQLWAKSTRSVGRHERRYFRHELVSALAFLEGRKDQPEADLVAYLIASHHGKARVVVAPSPGEQAETHNGARQVLGVRENELVRPVVLGDDEASPEFRTSLALFGVGSEDERATWVDRSARLRDEEYGPFVLGYLELLVRLADWRASSRTNSQPAVTA